METVIKDLGIKEVELHLGTLMTRTHMKHVKKAGGQYSHMRGRCLSKRYVRLPVDAVGVINELLALCKINVIVFQTSSMASVSAHVVVHSNVATLGEAVERMQKRYDAWLMQKEMMAS